MNYNWTQKYRKGVLESGLFLQLVTNPTDDNPETMMNIHCFGTNGFIKWLSVRFYFIGEQKNLTDGFLHWVSNDVKSVLEEKYSVKLEDGLYMHVEYSADIYAFPTEVPFSLGDYSFD